MARSRAGNVAYGGVSVSVKNNYPILKSFVHENGKFQLRCPECKSLWWIPAASSASFINAQCVNCQTWVKVELEHGEAVKK